MEDQNIDVLLKLEMLQKHSKNEFIQKNIFI